ncbi:MAG TPA: class II aldolase/adducin family protein [Stellaceae bacterium]|jgi:L-fuculose-phosphate aldolase|nr:class II aldolase/adducin family protein [Stellaceae bacterium]
MTPVEIKARLIDAGRLLVHLGLTQMAEGQVSARVPGETAQFYIPRHGIGLDEIQPDDILIVDLAGQLIAGNGQAPAEAAAIHGAIYRTRPDLGAVVLAHPSCGIAFTGIRDPLRPISQGGAMFLDQLGEAARGDEVAPALGPHKAVLLRHQAVITTGGTIDEAVLRLHLLENALKIQLDAQAAGELQPEFPREQILTVQRNFNEPRQFPVNFDYLVRRARLRH